MAEQKRKPGRPPGTKNKTKESAKKTREEKKAEMERIQAQKDANAKILDEIWAIILIAVGAFLAVALFTNGAGEFGHIIGNFFRGLFGFIANILPFYIIVLGLLLFAQKTVHINCKSFVLAFVILVNISIMNSTRFITAKTAFNLGLFYKTGESLDSGGLIGMGLGTALHKAFGPTGIWIITVSIIIICLLLFINTPISRYFEKAKTKRELRQKLKEKNAKVENLQLEMSTIGITDNKKLLDEKPVIEIASQKKPKTEEYSKTISRDANPSSTNKKSNIIELMKDDSLFGRDKQDISGKFGLDGITEAKHGFGIDDVNTTPGYGLGLYGNISMPKEEINGAEGLVTGAAIGAAGAGIVAATQLSNKDAREAVLSEEDIIQAKVSKRYKKPPIDLLNRNTSKRNLNDANDLQQKVDTLEETLKNFKVDARVIRVTQGPTVTRFEIQPSIGVKVSSIVRLADDIALNLRAKSIRIEAPIPGKAAVGIEIENDHINMVVLRDIIDSKEFKTSKSKISFAVGEDISGKAIVSDLKDMPHLLIAGATGSGKSVCINSIITSILYKANPNEVKLVLIDPKVVELGNYNDIPHLLIPVVTEPTKAAAALNWAVAEMIDRYKKFADHNVKDLESYNSFIKHSEEELEPLPQVVIVIDELADLMMAAPSQVEESICRLAQMARAAGMHLIVATQRPSVNVITGVIKANIPSRIAFAVSSQFDSRTIIDMGGAEKLVGKGDMLFSPSGSGKPFRVQGAFVSDSEVNAVIDFVKSQVHEVEYSSEVMSTIDTPTQIEQAFEEDELTGEAIEHVVRSGQASVSMLQRRFRIGYNRAARIIDSMEAKGIIGPADGSRPRQVLMTEDELILNNKED